MIRATALALLLAAIAHPSAGLAQQGSDELWESTMSVESDGMKIPAMTQRVCSPKGAREEQRMMDKNCRMLESKKSGNKVTFRFECQEGADKWSGTGEMESLGPDAYRGKMAASGTRGGEAFDMKTEMSGKRVGNCTYEDPGKQAAKMQAEHQAMMAKECDKQIEALDPTMFFGGAGLPAEAVFCKDRQGDFCARVAKLNAGMRSQDGYVAVLDKFGARWAEASRACGTDPATISSPVCKGAVDKKDWSFVSRYCAAEAAALRTQHCAGRTYTSVEPAWRDLCAAVGGLSYTAAQPAKKPSTTDKLKEGADKLKKFLKF